MIYANIITGGIGCGKSTFSNLLILEGFSVIDADKIGHDMLSEHKDIIVQHFGKEIIENGTINRVALGAIIFSNQEKKELLESLLHPLIYNEISRQCKVLEHKKNPYFVEIPLYFESKSLYNANSVICVYAPKNLQIERIMQRNGLSQEEAMRRVESQIDIETKRQKSDFVVENKKNLKALQHNLVAFLKEFHQIYKS
ncbi:dephospho-CoA kinase [Helicobacter didelphidarum]|uniref:Dephospho-CoA kinase n=1 Tax=Helicobacter didelphidarum TaxID=2040648 RepID=A0A3D8IA96_9HELI|nr:dephospho-CoA kinase [Helicobacter didelphidarum]RDU61876.1 dephospho-CoA kinase [Helicobacter didelphidarum]